MGAHSRVADLLLDWVPVTEAIRVAEAIRRLFDQLGDRANRHKARLRYVFEKIGIEAFRARFATELERVVADGVPAWQGTVVPNPERPAAGFGPPGAESRDGIRYLTQRQSGWVTVPLHLPLGFLAADDLARLGALAARFSTDRGLRTTIGQNLLLRFVKPDDLPALAAELRRLAADVLTPSPLACFVACAGASTCRLGLTLARNAAAAAADGVRQSGVSADTVAALDVHLNGCPNACGQQPIAPLGFFGTAQRVGGRLVPAYRVTVGGRCGAAGARLGVLVGQIPAKALPAFMAALAGDFEGRRESGEAFFQYVDRLGQAHFERLVSSHAQTPSYESRPEFYRDFGADADFSLAGRGAGECGTGVFEVIQADLAAAGKATDTFARLLPAARALLITRGVDAQDPDVVFREFEARFVNSGLAGEEFRPLLARARGYVQGWKEALQGADEAVGRLLQRVTLLYSTLDANLEFHPPVCTLAEPPTASPAGATCGAGSAAVGTCNISGRGTATPSGRAVSVDAELDLHGVGCPLNFVKAKLKLETLALGATLAIILDDGEPIANVPASFQNEGQELVASSALGDQRWRVLICRKR
jgi:sulfite reductase (ferredoxin)